MMHVCIKSTINVSKFPVRPMDLYCRIHSKSADYKRGPTSKARPKFSDLASRTLQDWPQCLFIPNAEDTLHGQVLMTVDCIGAPSGRMLKPNSSHTKSCNNHTWFLDTQPYGVSEPYLQYFILNGCICWWMCFREPWNQTQQINEWKAKDPRRTWVNPGEHIYTP